MTIGDAIIVAISAFLGSGFTEIAKHFTWKLREKRGTINEDVNDIINYIESLEEFCDTYWTRDAKDIPKEERPIIEARAIADMHYITKRVLNVFQSCYTPKETCKQHLKEINDIVTGGEFSDPDRKKDLGRYRSARQKFADLRHAIKEGRSIMLNIFKC